MGSKDVTMRGQWPNTGCHARTAGDENKSRMIEDADEITGPCAAFAPNEKSISYFVPLNTNITSLLHYGRR